MKVVRKNSSVTKLESHHGDLRLEVFNFGEYSDYFLTGSNGKYILAFNIDERGQIDNFDD
jgi:hypothetical protein